MVKQKLDQPQRMPNTASLDPKEELQLARRLHINLRYHVHTSRILASRKARQLLVVLIAVLVVLLTAVAALP